MGNKVDLKRIFGVLTIILFAIVVVLLIVLNLSTSKKSTSTSNGRVNNEFNSEFLIYDGKNIGSSVRALLSLVIGNARENSSDATKLIDIKYQLSLNGEFKEIFSNTSNTNIEAIEELRDSLELKHEYYVEYIYSKKTGNISGIIIKYTDVNASFEPDEA